ncbi:MAG: nucleotidyltransferase [Victivallales bacterium]
MNIQEDFQELLKLLEKHGVEYMIVGGYAVAFYGYPRFTKDLDIFYSLTTENISSLKKALIEFGFKENILSQDLFEKSNIIKIGIEPVRIDLINEIDGVNFSTARKSVVKGKYGDVDVTFIGKKDLIKNKKSTKRLQDKADLEKLA